jgi:hypothetical protein
MGKRKIYYKLTDVQAQTHNLTQWGEGMTHSGTGVGELCGSGWIHVYDHPLLAVLLNPIHAGFSEPLLWEAKGWGKTRDDYGLKRGVEHCTTLRQISLPELTTINRVAFAILCALEVYTEPQWRQWGEGWLSGKDRSKKEAAAEAAAAAWARAAAWAAWAAYAAAAAWAARGKPLDLTILAEQAMGIK